MLEETTKKLIKLLDIISNETKTGDLIHLLFKAKMLKTDLRQMEKEANLVQEKVEEIIVERLQEADLKSMKTGHGSVTIKASLYPYVDDAESFTRWVVSEERFEMLQKRCSPGAVVGYFDQKNELPDGISTFTKIRLNTRKA